MRKNIFYFTNPKRILLAFVLVATLSCNRTSGIDTVSSTANNAISSAQPGLSISPASSEQCLAGGFVYTIFSDFNKNGARDAGEPDVNSQVVCNGLQGEQGESGADGRDGYSTLFSLSRVSLDLRACASGAGLQINSGLDINRSGALEADEIEFAQILCDGAEGAQGVPGAGGPPGSDGLSAVFQTAFASAEMCPAGGSLILMALDANRNGVLDPDDRDMSSTAICNGTPAAVSAYAPVDVIVPCGQQVAFREVLLRLSNGQVLASFSDNLQGAYTRFALLPDGGYETTDHGACAFTLSTNGQTRSVSWGGQVRSSWPAPR